MNERMRECLEYFVLDHEGRICEDVPGDPGGRTKWGIIQTQYDDWRQSQGLPCRTVFDATEPEIYAIYESCHWVPCHCSDLQQKLDLVVFDTGVNMGNKVAIKLLQRVAGSSADGAWGPNTASAVAAISDTRDACLRYLDLRDWRYRSLVDNNHKLGKFLKGWLNRTNDLRDHL